MHCKACDASLDAKPGADPLEELCSECLGEAYDCLSDMLREDD